MIPWEKDILYQYCFRPLLLFSMLFCIALYSGIALAHQPRIADSKQKIVIEKPEISKAYYGELKGRPDIYVVNSGNKFTLYTEILVPDIPGVKKDKSVKIERVEGEARRAIANLSAEAFPWQPYHEKFAGDDYFKGPFLKTSAEPGRYIITVSSPENIGKYTFVIGEKESFTPREIVRMLGTLPMIKKDFFHKSPVSAFTNLIGLFLFLSLAVFIFLTWLVVFLIKRIGKAGRIKNSRG